MAETPRIVIREITEVQWPIDARIIREPIVELTPDETGDDFMGFSQDRF